MKTTEEMKVAAVAECDKLFKIAMELEADEDVISPIVKLHGNVSIQSGFLMRDETHHECVFLRIGLFTAAYLWSECSDADTDLFYRLLGLETRDAVAAEKARFFKEIDSCTLSLGKMAIRAKVAEARNTALVTLLTTMKENADQDDSDDATFRQWVFDAASYRLTANEKGVNHER